MVLRTDPAVAVGWLLGGTSGVGILVYALGIGLLVQPVPRVTPRRAPGAGGRVQVVGERAGEPAVATMSECPAPSATIPQQTTLHPTPIC